MKHAIEELRKAVIIAEENAKLAGKHSMRVDARNFRDRAESFKEAIDILVEARIKKG